MMILRAATNIPANTELRIRYFPPALKTSTWTSATGALSAAPPCAPTSSSCRRTETLIKHLAETYPRPLEQALRLGLWEPSTLIAGAYDSLKQQGEAREAMNGALTAIGIMLDGGVDGLLVVKKSDLAMENLLLV
ncbi:Tetratricopeptide-like helical [Penicillium digitatum]|uniref:Tetratricopeptide-like helical n=1 Tax=Penicillium digitatum TaxID=36651 RepID=A0A7T6XHX1_PENDI|nr:Tetratricopeptide-like helical [Penicillium digitatum]